MSSGANVDGAPLPEDVEENGKEEEVGEFGFHTLVGPFWLFHLQRSHLCNPTSPRHLFNLYLVGLIEGAHGCLKSKCSSNSSSRQADELENLRSSFTYWHYVDKEGI